jgi:hypothetical protein
MSNISFGAVIKRVLVFWFFHIVGVLIGFAMIFSLIWLAVQFLAHFMSR